VVEMLHVQPERSVFLEVEQFAQDEILENRFAVRRQTHELVFTRVDAKTGIVSERRIKQSQRVREVKLPEQVDPISLAHAKARGRPLSHAVHREKSRLGV